MGFVNVCIFCLGKEEHGVVKYVYWGHECVMCVLGK